MTEEYIDHEFFLERRDSCLVDASARVTLTGYLPVDREKSWQSFRRLVTKWVRETTMGQRVWMDSSEDLNVGDLLNENAVGELCKFLPFEGIHKLCIDRTDCDEVRSYDEVLVNLGELEKEPPKTRSCEFFNMTEIVPDTWRDWFFDRISESAPFGWGDNKHSLVSIVDFLEFMERRLENAADEEGVDQSEIDGFLNRLGALPAHLLIDLEN